MPKNYYISLMNVESLSIFYINRIAKV